MIRVGGVASLLVVAAVLAYLAVAESQNYLIPAAVVTAVAMTGVHDLLQRKHSSCATTRYLDISASCWKQSAPRSSSTSLNKTSTDARSIAMSGH
jgi:hypothetical protein